MVKTRAELPFIGDQIVCLSHDHAARSGPALHQRGALSAMSYDNPVHRSVLEAEGLRRWVAPQLDGSDALREASAQQGFLKRPAL